jgi:hypothetical protein
VQQDPALELAQLRPRLDAELAGQPVAGLLHRVERVGLAAGAIEREHPLAHEPLAQRVIAGEVVELGQKLRAGPAFEVGLDALLDCRQPPLLEPLGLGIRERLVEDVGERRPAPHGQRLVEKPRRDGRVAARARPLERLFEAVEVELARSDSDQIAGRPAQQPIGAQQAPKPRDVAVERLRRAGRRLVAPESRDQPVARDRLVGAEQEHREQAALLGPAERKGRAVPARLHRTEDRELHDG